MKNIRYFLEFLLVWGFYNLCRIIGLDRASALGGKIAVAIGPWLKVNVTARRNLEKAMPGLKPTEVEKILHDMWDNLGRTIGEFAHLEKLTGEGFLQRVKVDGLEHIDAVRTAGKGGILFSGHFANWEIMPKTAYEYGLPLALVYRPANNRWVNDFIIKARTNHQGMFSKGPEAARGLVKALKDKKYGGLLVDQKMNEGIKLKFFGRDAMTAPALVQLGMKFDCPLVPVLVRRGNGANFTIRVFPPLAIAATGNTEQDVATNMQAVNNMLESWARENPSQWFWVHKRWVE